MNRRTFLIESSGATLALGLPPRLLQVTGKEEQRRNGGGPSDNSHATSEAVLPGTSPLTMQGDLAAQMVDGIHQYLLRRIQDAVQERGRLWQRDYQSAEAYNRSVLPNRARFRQII